MARVTLLHDYVTREPFYLEGGHTRRMFRRIVGALAWPYGETPGCALVLGEIRTAQTIVGGRHELFILEERQTGDTQELVETAASLQAQWHVRKWATPLYDTRIYLIDDYNDEQRRRRLNARKIIVGDPAGWTGKGEGLMPMYMAFVQRRTQSEKTLHFGRDSMAAEEIRRLDVNDQVIRHPSAAAAFWAVAGIDMETMPEWDDRRESRGGPADPIGGY